MASGYWNVPAEISDVICYGQSNIYCYDQNVSTIFNGSTWPILTVLGVSHISILPTISII